MREHILTIPKSAFEFQAFRASGPGGQKRNKTDSAVRVVHKDSGLSAYSTEHKSQLANKHEAFKRLANLPAFKNWVSNSLSDIEERVNNELLHTKVEYFSDGEWIEQTGQFISNS